MWRFEWVFGIFGLVDCGFVRNIVSYRAKWGWHWQTAPLSCWTFDLTIVSIFLAEQSSRYAHTTAGQTRTLAGQAALIALADFYKSRLFSDENDVFCVTLSLSSYRYSIIIVNNLEKTRAGHDWNDVSCVKLIRWSSLVL